MDGGEDAEVQAGVGAAPVAAAEVQAVQDLVHVPVPVLVRGVVAFIFLMDSFEEKNLV